MIRSKQVWTNPLSPPQPSPHFFPSLISMAQPMNFRSIYSVIQVLLPSCYITPKSLSDFLIFTMAQMYNSKGCKMEWDNVGKQPSSGSMTEYQCLFCFLSFMVLLVLKSPLPFNLTAVSRPFSHFLLLQIHLKFALRKERIWPSNSDRDLSNWLGFLS